jgi:hypothetical protein
MRIPDRYTGEIADLERCGKLLEICTDLAQGTRPSPSIPTL